MGSGLVRACLGDIKLLIHNLLSLPVQLGWGPVASPYASKSPRSASALWSSTLTLWHGQYPKQSRQCFWRQLTPCIWLMCPKSQFRHMSMMRISGEDAPCAVWRQICWTLQCPESGCLFPTSCGIPNTLMTDEETKT